MTADDDSSNMGPDYDSLGGPNMESYLHFNHCVGRTQIKESSSRCMALWHIYLGLIKGIKCGISKFNFESITFDVKLTTGSIFLCISPRRCFQTLIYIFQITFQDVWN